MSITWVGIKQRIEQHRLKYPRSGIVCPSEEEMARIRAEKGDQGVLRLFENVMSEIMKEERVLTPKVHYKKRPTKEGS